MVTAAQYSVIIRNVL